jgi:hypothetical protein
MTLKLILKLVYMTINCIKISTLYKNCFGKIKLVD